MKKLILLVLSLTLFVTLMLPGTVWAEGGFAGGDGTVLNPYQINTSEQLASVSEAVYMGNHFILKDDIDLTETVWGEVYGGAGWYPIGTEGGGFMGSFNGDGHTITGLFINRPEMNSVGLFGSTYGTIENLKMKNVNVTGNNYVGGLMGNTFQGTITNTCSEGIVTGNNYVGGLMGWNREGSIYDSYSISDVTGNSKVGGLAGDKTYGDIINSYATGAVTGNDCVGGLVGYSHSYIYLGTITNSYATGVVTGNTNVGGLLGYNSSTSITASYYNRETSSCGEIGVGSGSDTGVTGLSITQMKQQDNFLDWNFSDPGTWAIDTCKTYPNLQWQTDDFDYAPPAFAAGYPQAEEINRNDLNLLVQVDEVSTAYYVVLPPGADAPSATQVKAGTCADDTLLAANLRGSIVDLTAGSEETAAITGLSSATPYDIYVVAEDGAGNSLITMLEVITDGNPVEIETYSFERKPDWSCHYYIQSGVH